VLAHKSVREHPNIAQLQGICWDVSAFDDKPWPVLVFEKTHLGDLYEFAMLPAGRTMNFSQRLRLCMDMGRAIMDMHSMSKCSHFERARTSYFNFIDIVHGDIKPDNVLVFTEESGQYKARVTDFGYSSRFTNDEDRLKLPITVPWNAPEVDRLNREWTPSQAKQADLFSFGMLCVWLVFETYFLVVPNHQQMYNFRFSYPLLPWSRQSLFSFKSKANFRCTFCIFWLLKIT
jgi:serine/threonine protein kinase